MPGSPFTSGSTPQAGFTQAPGNIGYEAAVAAKAKKARENANAEDKAEARAAANAAAVDAAYERAAAAAARGGPLNFFRDLFNSNGGGRSRRSRRSCRSRRSRRSCRSRRSRRSCRSRSTRRSRN